MTAAPQPPRFARWLLRRTLDGPVRSAIVGDLDEEFSSIVERVGPRAARRWYWRQAVLSIAACLREPSVHELEPPERLSVRSAMMLDRRGLSSDLRAACRFCWRHPLLSTIVMLTLGVGIGVNAAVFSVLNATYLKTLPIPNAHRLVSIGVKEGGSFTYPEYVALRDLSGLAALFAGGRTATTLDSDSDNRSTRQRVVVEMVTANYFSALGVGRGARGRLFDAADGEPGMPPVAVLSDAAWRERFGSEPSAIGRTVRLHQALFTIVGVAPSGFTGTQIGYGPDVWVPLTQAPLIDGNREMLGPGSAWLGFGGILDRPDSLATVAAALNARWQAEGRDDVADVRLIPRGKQWYSPAPESRLRLIAVFSLLILAIACLNVSTLIGSTVHARQKELAIRASLGAGRVRLLRQLLIEHVVLAAFGGVAGGLLGTWMARGLAPLMASRFTPSDLDVSPDLRVALFTFGVAFVSAVAIGVMPAIRWSRVNTLPALQGQQPAGLTRLFGSNSLWWLMPWQIAFGTVLLASAGLLGKTVQQLKLGVQASAPERVWFASVTFDAAEGSAARWSGGLQQFREQVALQPGVEAVALTSGRPLSSISRGPLRVEGLTKVPDSRPMPWGPPPPPPPRGANRLEKLWIVSHNFVTPGYFAALALPVRAGRDFTNADDASAPRVAIINETLAARAFGKENPIGRRVSFAPTGPYDIEIVGVVRDLRYEHLREAAPDGIFFPLAQTSRETGDVNVTGARQPTQLTTIVRMRAGERMTRDLLVQRALSVNPNLFVDRVGTFDEEANGALSEERVLAGIGWALGITALVLLVIGLYGTLAAAVVRSRRELAVRVALGAQPGSLRMLVVSRCLSVAALGLALGLPLAYAATKSFAHLLYGVRPFDPAVAAITASIIVVTAAAAGFVPARRAARVDPVVALRAE